MKSLSLWAAIILCIAHDSLSSEHQMVSNVTKADNNDFKVIVNLSQNASLDKAKPTNASLEANTETQSEEKPQIQDGQQDNKDARRKSGRDHFFFYLFSYNIYVFSL